MAIQEVTVPDLEGAADVTIIEIYPAVGDKVEKEDSLISLESDKAVMDIPSPLGGTIKEFKVAEGDKVNQNDVILLLETAKEAPQASPPPQKEAPPEPPAKTPPPAPAPLAAPPPAAAPPVNAQTPGAAHHATPSVRQFARELGIDLGNINPTGPKDRITREDLTLFVKNKLEGRGQAAGGFALPPIPTADFGSYGPIEEEPLGRIKKISGPHVHRNWVGIPHVTQFEEADITELEAFRKQLNAENAKQGIKISPLIFLIKAAVTALKAFPDFNASLSSDGNRLIRKNYYHIGIAVDTSGGLLIPVIKNADQQGVLELAQTLGDLSLRAREGKLKADEMKGGTFTISSLGGIGGTYFTPIVNAPEAAILGLSRSFQKPVWNGEAFVPRLTLPFSVSYDHRIIDGAEGARFAVYLSKIISDMRRALL